MGTPKFDQPYVWPNMGAQGSALDEFRFSGADSVHKTDLAKVGFAARVGVGKTGIAQSRAEHVADQTSGLSWTTPLVDILERARPHGVPKGSHGYLAHGSAGSQQPHERATGAPHMT